MDDQFFHKTASSFHGPSPLENGCIPGARGAMVDRIFSREVFIMPKLSPEFRDKLLQAVDELKDELVRDTAKILTF